MGTNFYIVGHQDDDSPKWHIGKRSAAGLFCWDCNVTLCKAGNAGIHVGENSLNMSENPRRRWHSACPICRSTPAAEPLANSSGGRELGFNKNAPTAKRGVASCSSFTWAMSQEELKNKIKKWRFWPWKTVVVDEYGHRFTAKQFEAVLSECPVRFNMVGSNFS